MLPSKWNRLRGLDLFWVNPLFHHLMFWSVLDVIESEMSAKGTGWDLSPSSLSLPSPALAPPGSTTCFLQAGLTIKHCSISPMFTTHSSLSIYFKSLSTNLLINYIAARIWLFQPGLPPTDGSGEGELHSTKARYGWSFITCRWGEDFLRKI